MKMKCKRGRPYWQPHCGLISGERGAVGPWAKLDKCSKAAYPVLQILSNEIQTGARQTSIARFSGISEVSVRKAGRNLTKSKLTTRKKIMLGKKRFRYETHFEKLKGHGGYGGVLDNYVVIDMIWKTLSLSAKSVYIVLISAAPAGMTLIREQEWMKDMGLRQEVFGEMAKDLFLAQGFDWEKFMAFSWDDAMKQRFRPHVVMATFSRKKFGKFGLMTLAKYAGVDVKTVRKAIKELERRRLCIVFPPCRGSGGYQFMLPLPRHMQLKRNLEKDQSGLQSLPACESGGEVDDGLPM